MEITTIEKDGEKEHYLGNKLIYKKGEAISYSDVYELIFDLLKRVEALEKL